MGRPQSVAGGRPHVVPVRLSHSEVEALDRLRGGLTRTAYMRLLISRAVNKP